MMSSSSSMSSSPASLESDDTAPSRSSMPSRVEGTKPGGTARRPGWRCCGMDSTCIANTAFARMPLRTLARSGESFRFACSSSARLGAVTTTEAPAGALSWPPVAWTTTTVSSGTSTPQVSVRMPSQSLSASSRQLSGSRPSTSGPQRLWFEEWACMGVCFRGLQQPRLYSTPTSFLTPEPFSAATWESSSQLQGSCQRSWSLPSVFSSSDSASKQSRTARVKASVMWTTALSKGRLPLALTESPATVRASGEELSAAPAFVAIW
mmetsp:Transcript_9278/g.16878  ORF Transcript_9278/g.16878 Transcript_9278/m.16878 type:complete len:265 (-) Transcript_9278:3004-3798(-)